jgi:hypothetical protein
MGYQTIASGGTSTAMGRQTTASGSFSTAMGIITTASGYASTAIGGYTEATGKYSVAMGQRTTATGDHSVAMGYRTTASANASFAMGLTTTASGIASVAIGCCASTNNHKGSFVYGDNSTHSFVNATADDQFMVRAAGGVYFYTNSTLTSGVYLSSGGGSWNVVSDRNKKENFKNIDAENILNKLSKINIQSWNYKTQDPDIRHIGIVAQDFYHNFGYGESDTTVTSIDLAGVNMVAVQGLIGRTEKLSEQNRELLLQVSNQQSEIDQLKEMVNKLIDNME